MLRLFQRHRFVLLDLDVVNKKCEIRVITQYSMAAWRPFSVSLKFHYRYNLGVGIFRCQLSVL